MSGARWLFATVAALSVGAACSDDPTTGSARVGTVTLRLTTPHADDGAMTFEVSGPPIDGVSAADGSLQLFTRRVGESTIVGAVVGGRQRRRGDAQVPDAGARPSTRPGARGRDAECARALGAALTAVP
jgi:hypothetical protein